MPHPCEPGPASEPVQTRARHNCGVVIRRRHAGVQRQYMGCAGRVANGINTVHLSYVREKTGHALVGAQQWIPVRGHR